MNKVYPVQSREVWCCGARSWALVIGWIQTIFSAIGAIALGILVFTEIKRVSNENEEIGDELKIMIGVTAGVLIFVILSFALGIVLIVGVKQANAGKIKFWCVIQIIKLGFCALVLVASLATSDFVRFAYNLIGIAINVFFLWVVNVYRKEIISNVPYNRNV